MTPSQTLNTAPSGKNLVKATIGAMAAAAIVLVAFVLPAEYGIDPSGIGKVLGLTDLGKMKTLQQQAAAPETGKDDVIETLVDGSTRVTITIRPYGGREIKGWLKQGEQMPYEWSAQGVEMEYDLHGEPKEGGAAAAKSFELGKAAAKKGVFAAPFEGLHGWFWKNLTTQPVRLVVTVSGPVQKFAPITAGTEEQGQATSAAAPAVADNTAYDTRLPLKQFMQNVMQHSAQILWDKTAIISDENGIRSTFPKTDAGWQAAADDAQVVAELTNVLMLPGRRVAEVEWDKAVVATRVAAEHVSAAAAKKNEDAFLETTLELNDACASCHTHYAPGL